MTQGAYGYHYMAPCEILMEVDDEWICRIDYPPNTPCADLYNGGLQAEAPAWIKYPAWAYALAIPFNQANKQPTTQPYQYEKTTRKNRSKPNRHL